MLCLGFKPGAAGWSLSYGGRLVKNDLFPIKHICTNGLDTKIVICSNCRWRRQIRLLCQPRLQSQSFRH